MRVLCAGHLNHDVILRLDRLPGADESAVVEDEHRGGGGSAANVAWALAALDAESTLLASVGDDDRGRRLRAELDSAGVDCNPVVVANGETASTRVLVDPEGRVATLGQTGATEAYDPAALSASTLADADRLHLTGQERGRALALADRARAAGVPVSVDPGRRTGVRDDRALFERADLIFLNDAEAARVHETGALRDADATVVVTSGADGAAARTTDGVVRQTGHDVAARDPTGAGDAFAAGYLLVRETGGSVREALAVGNACGALATTTVGARLEADREAVRRLAGADAPADF